MSLLRIRADSWQRTCSARASVRPRQFRVIMCPVPRTTYGASFAEKIGSFRNNQGNKMPLPLTRQEFKKYLYASADERYSFFIKRARIELQFWLLRNAETKDIVFTEDPESQSITIPVWPHPDFAMEFTKKNALTNCEPKELSLVKWLANWVPKLDEVSIEIAVFPTGDSDCVTIEAREFTEEIDPQNLGGLS